MKRILISASVAGLCLMACLSGTALLSAPVTWRSAQISQATKAAERAAADGRNAELKSLYEAHQWFKLRDAVQATDAQAFYLGAVASVFNDIERAEKSLRSVIKSAPQSEQASEARVVM